MVYDCTFILGLGITFSGPSFMTHESRIFLWEKGTLSHSPSSSKNVVNPNLQFHWRPNSSFLACVKMIQQSQCNVEQIASRSMYEQLPLASLTPNSWTYNQFILHLDLNKQSKTPNYAVLTMLCCIIYLYKCNLLSESKSFQKLKKKK